MALEAETAAIVAKFDYTDDDVNKAVKEFLRQLGRYIGSDDWLSDH